MADEDIPGPATTTDEPPVAIQQEMPEEPLTGVTPPKVTNTMEEPVALSTVALVGLVCSAGLTLSLVLSIVYYCFVKPRLAKRPKQRKQQKPNSTTIDDNTVSVDDLVYAAHQLSPSSTHLDVLWTICSTPENIQWSLQGLEKVEAIRAERLEQVQKEESKKAKQKEQVDFSSLLEGDWDEGGSDEDEDEDDEAAAAKLAQKRAKEAEEEKKAALERLKNATGQAVQLLEGIDDGVLGQQWVENSLKKAGQWPPPNMGFLGSTKFEYDGKMVSALDHPGLRRNICMTQGRLNSTLLNSSPELLKAGANKMIDQTYFKSSMLFRNRVGILLEAVLRVAITLKSYDLVRTIVEVMAIFRLGSEDVSKFEETMQKTYGILPRLIVKDKDVSTPDCDNMAVGDMLTVQLDLVRPHAEQFTKVKVAQCQKQGIPPQAGLQAYRETWWVIVRRERLDGQTVAEKIDRDNALVKLMDGKDVKKFEQDQPASHQLAQTMPLVMPNIAQKGGKVKVELPAPGEAGKYRIHIAICSSDFLGADQEVFVDADIKAASEVKRAPKKEEAKKDK